MSRRRLATALALLAGGCVEPPLALPRAPSASTEPRPTAAQLRWQQAEFGVVFHYDLHVFADGRYVQREARARPAVDVDLFAPASLDTDQWVRAAKAAGARFAILTASHETGFRLWRSDVNPYSVAATRWGQGGRDPVAEFHAACLRHGLLPGVYVGTRWNAQLGVADFRVTDRSPLSQAAYNRLVEAEVTELCTRYGAWFEIWFDGGAHGPAQGGPDLLPIVQAHQPDALFYHSLERADARWGGSESGTVPYPCWATFPFRATGAGETAPREIAADGFALLKRGDPEGRWWMPAMSDAPLRGRGGHEWFWEPGDERLLYPVDALVDMYCRSVGHNSTLILGATPDDQGRLPAADAARLREMGEAVARLFSRQVAGAEAIPAGGVVELPLEGAFDVLVLQEDIRRGERVRAYDVQVRAGGVWRTVARGSCVGHKRIQRLDTPARGDALRVQVTSSRGRPRLRSVSAFLAPSGS
ncbi:MAG: alpha-L-fucosidase [Planctomycetota bacterium]